MQSITQIAHDAIENELYFTPDECLKFLRDKSHFNSFAIQLNRTLDMMGAPEEAEKRADFLRKQLNNLNLEELSAEFQREILCDIGLGKRNEDGTIKSIVETAALRKEVKDWLSGEKLPGHIRIVLICFALNLSVTKENYGYDINNISAVKWQTDTPHSDDLDLTEALFVKGSRDCAFNLKDANDIVFFYCLLNRRPFAKAIEFIEKYRETEAEPKQIDSNRVTQIMRDIFSENGFDDESDFLNTLCESKPYLTSFSRTVSQTFREIKYNIQVLLSEQDQTEPAIRGETESIPTKHWQDNTGKLKENVIAPHCSNCGKLFYVEFPGKGSVEKRNYICPFCAHLNLAKNSELSNEEIIHEIFFDLPDLIISSTKKKTGRSFKDSVLYDNEQGVVANLPNYTDLNALQNFENTQEKDRPSLEKIRKILILFFFYYYIKKWDSREDKGSCNYYDFFEELSDKLAKSGLPCLYYAEPFDWLVLKCVYLIELIYQASANSNININNTDALGDPLDLFNEILALSFSDESED